MDRLRQDLRYTVQERNFVSQTLAQSSNQGNFLVDTRDLLLLTRVPRRRKRGLERQAYFPRRWKWCLQQKVPFRGRRKHPPEL